jgi:hypothetical protein
MTSDGASVNPLTAMLDRSEMPGKDQRWGGLGIADGKVWPSAVKDR